jgi:hypothetical protein
MDLGKKGNLEGRKEGRKEKYIEHRKRNSEVLQHRNAEVHPLACVTQ